MISPLTQSLIQGAALLLAAPLVPILVRALRQLMTRQPVTPLGAELKAWGKELTLRDEPIGLWTVRCAPLFIFGIGLCVITLDKANDVFVPASLMVAALAALALGNGKGYARVGLAAVALFLGLGAREVSPGDVASLVLTVATCAVLGAELVRESAGKYRGFSRAVITTALSACALVLGLLAAQMVLPTTEPGFLVVQGLVVVVAFALVQEVTERAALARADGYILAALLGLLSFIVAATLQIV